MRSKAGKTFSLGCFHKKSTIPLWGAFSLESKLMPSYFFLEELDPIFNRFIPVCLRSLNFFSTRRTSIWTIFLGTSSFFKRAFIWGSSSFFTTIRIEPVLGSVIKLFKIFGEESFSIFPGCTKEGATGRTGLYVGVLSIKAFSSVFLFLSSGFYLETWVNET